VLKLWVVASLIHVDDIITQANTKEDSKALACERFQVMMRNGPGWSLASLQSEDVRGRAQKIVGSPTFDIAYSDQAVQ